MNMQTTGDSIRLPAPFRGYRTIYNATTIRLPLVTTHTLYQSADIRRGGRRVGRVRPNIAMQIIWRCMVTNAIHNSDGGWLSWCDWDRWWRTRSRSCAPNAIQSGRLSITKRLVVLVRGLYNAITFYDFCTFISKENSLEVHLFLFCCCLLNRTILLNNFRAQDPTINATASVGELHKWPDGVVVRSRPTEKLETRPSGAKISHYIRLHVAHDRHNWKAHS